MSYFLQLLISTQKPIIRLDKEEFRKLKKIKTQSSLALKQQMKKRSLINFFSQFYQQRNPYQLV